MKLKELFEIVEKRKAEATPEELEQDVKLYVDNAWQQAEMQSGEWGDSTELCGFYFGGNTLHVMG